MSSDNFTVDKARTTLETVTELSANDLSEICDATEEAILAGVALAGSRRRLVTSSKIIGAGCC